jgi:ribosomal protein L11 methylase PrmA
MIYELQINTHSKLSEAERMEVDEQIRMQLFSLNITDYIEEIECVGELVTDEEQAQNPDLNHKPSIFKIFRNHQNELQEIKEKLISVDPFKNIIYIFTELANEGWAEVWQEGERNQIIGDFNIKIILEDSAPAVQALDSKPQRQLYPIFLRGGRQSFGSGQHVTTRACLALLSQSGEAIEQRKNCLDVGTGNGVLAIAAHRMGFKTVVATDLSQDIIADAKVNVALNHAKVEFRCTDEIPAGECDLIFCNILLPELLRLLPSIVQRLNDKSVLIVAGFHRKEIARVRQKVGTLEMVVINEVIEKGWPALHLALNSGDSV